MESSQNYVYKKIVDWSLLTEGVAIPLENQVIFGRNMGRFLARGESRDITLVLDGKGYKAKINSLNFAPRHNRKKDTLQIRYAPGGELAGALRAVFAHSYRFFMEERGKRDRDDRSMIKLPDGRREYLAIYTTEYEDTYVLEAIIRDAIDEIYNIVKDQPEVLMEAAFNYDVKDPTAAIFESPGIAGIRKMNRKIGDNLKLLYEYQCQICGRKIGEEYSTHVAEAHHIDYFVRSLNNDADNQLILCPNHHGIIHNTDPTFDRRRKIYLYPNGFREGLRLNKHL